MKIDRLTRVNELLRREIGEDLFRVMDPQSFDLAAVTVTHVVTSSDLRTARVLVSIRNHVEQRGKMLARLQHHSPEIQHRIAEKVILKYTPRLTFELDSSIENGDRVLGLLDQLNQAGVASPAPQDRPVGEDDQGRQPDDTPTN